MFSKQEAIIDKLFDIPNVLEESVFNRLIEVNNNNEIRFSSYVLSDMWNDSYAVKFGFASRKTANDFHSNPNWEK
jgi:hypothetical protein